MEDHKDSPDQVLELGLTGIEMKNVPENKLRCIQCRGPLMEFMTQVVSTGWARIDLTRLLKMKMVVLD